MEFKLEESNDVYSGSFATSEGDGTLVITINGKDHRLNLISLKSQDLEFMLDHSYFSTKILESNSSNIRLLVNGEQIILKKHSKLTEILEKSLALTDRAGSENRLTSQIPGRVVSLAVTPGSEVKQGDAVIILESMKMQVAIKAHRDGKIKEIKVKEGSTVSRNEVVATIE